MRARGMSTSRGRSRRSGGSECGVAPRPPAGAVASGPLLRAADNGVGSRCRSLGTLCVPASHSEALCASVTGKDARMNATRSGDAFGTLESLDADDTQVHIHSLPRLADRLGIDLTAMPYAIRVLLEAALRHCDGFQVTEDDVKRLAGWSPTPGDPAEIAFKPARVVLQDFTGVPCVVDLAAMRDAVKRLGGDPSRVNPLVPVDLVIDHSVQVDVFGTLTALERNAEIEFERNRERYEFLRWGQKAFDNFRVVPPATGIVHQVNLEYLARGVMTETRGGLTLALPDSLVGTDSHTTMINGLGVVGWGVGGIEAEAVMLGQPLHIVMPEVVGFRLTGQLREGVTATDLVLTVTQMLRKKSVVDKFVEF